MKKQPFSARAIAARVLVSIVLEGRSFDPKMIRAFMPSENPREESFIAYLCFGTLRYYFYLQRKLHGLLQKPLKTKDADLELLMLIGLYQLYFSDTPAYASLSGTVDACGALNKPWAKGLLNGVLRQAQRQKNAQAAETSLTIARAAHPKWLIKEIEKAWPDETSSLLEANMQHPPFALRVNAQKIAAEEYLRALNKNGMSAALVKDLSSAIVLATPVGVESLPHFDDGWVSVQDVGAQLVSECFRPLPYSRVLDACAAPGGKTAHLLENDPTLQITAVEKDPSRFIRLQQTLQRGQHAATLLCEDATNPSAWWDGQLYDAILLDAPCSATGIVRRHPDIKLHRQPDDIEQLFQIQASLLEALWPLLKPNGILLYITCSILPKENVEQMMAFLEKHPDAQEWPIEGDWGLMQAVGRQLLPGQSIMDGFYYARLRKHG